MEEEQKKKAKATAKRKVPFDVRLTLAEMDDVRRLMSEHEIKDADSVRRTIRYAGRMRAHLRGCHDRGVDPETDATRPRHARGLEDVCHAVDELLLRSKGKE